MKAVVINPELKEVKEKHYGLDMYTIAGVSIAVAAALAINLMLPDWGVLKPIISAIVVLPILFISIKDFYGLKFHKLAFALIRTTINNKPLIYESEGEWKELNKYARSRRPQHAEIEEESE